MLEFIALSSAAADLGIPIAASRAGSLGVLDLQFFEPEGAVARLAAMAERSRGTWGVQVDGERVLEAVLAAQPDGLGTVILSGARPRDLGRLVGRVHTHGLRAVVVATDVKTAVTAEHAGADAVIGKGYEAAAWIGEEGAFVLLQRLLGTVSMPVYVQGGIGLHTVAAAYAGGAAGVVLDSQLLLARESPLGATERSDIASMDGSETATLGAALGAPFRIHHGPGRQALERLSGLEDQIAPSARPRERWRRAVRQAVRDGSQPRILPLGQDGALAAPLARRFHTVGGIISGLRQAALDAARSVRRENPLAEGAPLAQAHGTRYPLVQGPMTRVSDRAEFAASVAEHGALPFLALALMRAPEADTLLERTREMLGPRAWGVGILGFVPRELRAEQLAVVRAHQPPFALIAGGRPDQARELEEDGITTYLHVPSPGLLRLYLANGARRFVFEGRECGGHVGPRTSFVLWDTMLDVVLDTLGDAVSESQILLAGGIHDARSAAMAAATMARASTRGVKVGALMGTAYLFTREATDARAITTRFQAAAIEAADTVLLESGPGHATRCLPSPFVAQFEAEKSGLAGRGASSEEARMALEQLNIGRLRIAAKGLDRHPDYGRDPQAPKLAEVPEGEQWDRGMYMIGQVAVLRREVTTLADLHRDVSDGSTELLGALRLPEPPALPAPPAADVAIIGMACIVPGAPDTRRLWANILAKVDAISEVPARRWDWTQMYDPDPSARDKVYSRWGGFIGAVSFDPIAFGMPPRSLSSIEPFQLLALLTAQNALADAGYITRPFDRERTSVILGAGGGGADLSVAYAVRSALPALIGDSHAELERELYERLPEWTEDSFAGLLMNVASGRIANRLDLGGTNYTVDAACASSLAAIGAATKELQSHTSDLVLAGGVDALQNPFTYLCFSKTHALSPRGRCRPFDASADGIAISEGFATVVLKRLSDAERDGDRIYAVIRGVGAASDGRDRSLTAPRPEGQMRALRRAYAQAGFSPATVGLVEAHGTGTVAGDGAEVQALTTVFSEHGTPRQSCAIGSIKSMIGHTKATAGVAGLVKAALALHHRVLPPTIGVTEPNPKASFGSGPFYVNTEARPWLTGGASHPRRAGVSAFGFGGTDFHIVLEEYQGALTPREATVDPWPAELLLWRGSRETIASEVQSIAAQLEEGAEPNLADLAHTLALAADAKAPGHDGAPGSAATATLAVVVESLADLRVKLETARELLKGPVERVHTPDGLHWSEAPMSQGGAVAFLFPGQGSQALDMVRELLVAFPEAREPFELADRVLDGCFEQPLSRFVFPPPPLTVEERRQRQQQLTDTHVAQPALGAAELAYLWVLEAAGLRAEMTAGHSFGELVALACAGALDDEELLRLAELRGRYMRDAAGGDAGAMAAADAGAAELALLVERGGVVVANLNAPRQTVLSGAQEQIDSALEWCAQHGIAARPLPVACAFHSPHVADAQQRLARELERVAIRVPRLPVFSNTTGEEYRAEPGAIAEVLSEHLVRPVQFVREIEAMYARGGRVFVEVGPRSVLTGLVEQILGEREHLAVPVDRPGRSGLLQLVHCLAALASEGCSVRTELLRRGRRAETLDLRRLAHERDTTAAGRDRWVVDGGGVRRIPAPAADGSVASETPALSQGTSRSVREEGPDVATTTTNGAGSASPLADPAKPVDTPGAQTELPGHRPVPARAPAPPEVSPRVGAAFSGAERAGDVMHQYHVVMQHFLETERAVMLSYLGAARDGAPSWVAATALPATPRPPLLPAPAPVPERQPALARTVPEATQRAVPVPSPASPPAGAVTAEPPPGAEVPATAASGSPLTATEIEVRLLALVSERTGYPTDMLGFDADLEGDLGIDSIKRVEIAGTFAQSLHPDHQGLIDVEQLTASRTLREVIAVLQSALAPDEQPAIAGAVTPGQGPFEREPAETERIGRFVVQTESAPPIPARGTLNADGAVVITDDGSGVAPSLARRLQAEGHAVTVVPRASLPHDAGEAQALSESICKADGTVKALVHLAIAADGDDEPYGALSALMLLIQALWNDLAVPGVAVLGATALGGAFGIGSALSADDAPRAAIHGLLKTLALEQPHARVKAVDVTPGPAEFLASQLHAELEAADGLVEIGYRDGERRRPVLTTATLEARPEGEMVDRDSVVLLTGGARGITAEVAIRLAERHRCTLLLVGRTAPEAEPAYAAGLSEPADLRRAIIGAHRRADDPISGSTVERELAHILAVREVHETLRRLEATGSRVEYLRCDVRDHVALTLMVEDIYSRYGRIDGVVHGAGVIEDRLIPDKRPDSFQRVMATKAGAAQTLAQALRADSLRFLIMFSSVSGRFGNRGQADYAAASEVLNKLAQALDQSWPGRVTSINWGPWRTAGMVSPELERQFRRRGVALIPIETGCRLFMDELTRGHKGEVEVVIGAATGLAGSQFPAGDAADADAPRTTLPERAASLPLLATGCRISRPGPREIELRRAFSLDHDRYLDDHRVDGVPVVPFAMAMELMAQAAVLADSGRDVRTLTSVRMLKGITLSDQEQAQVHVRATATDRDGALSLSVESLEDGRAHYRALIELGAADSPAKVVGPADIPDLAPFPTDVADAYRDLLFHGPCFQAISAIQGMDRRGATALLRTSDPGHCVSHAAGRRWLLDPVLIDAALQVQLLWARLEWDVTLLPSELARYVRFSEPVPGEPCRHELRMGARSQPPLFRADHWFFGADGRLLATMQDMVGIGSRALNRLGTARA